MKDAQAKFFNDPRYQALTDKINDIRLGDIYYNTAHEAWSDAPEDFVEWLEEEFDPEYCNVVVIHEVILEYIMDTEEEYDWTQEELDELFEYAEKAPVKVFFPER